MTDPDAGLTEALAEVERALGELRSAIETVRKQGLTIRRHVNTARRDLRMLTEAAEVQAQEQAATAKTLNKVRQEVIRIGDLDRGIRTLTRFQTVDPAELPYPLRLTAQRFRSHSQREEDGVIQAILREVGVANRCFVELGCGTNGGNSGYLAAELGWTGLMVDCSQEAVHLMRRRLGSRGVSAVEHWIRRDGVNGLLREHGAEGELDLLSIDIDGNDIWVWEAITACSPRLVVIEYNTAFGPERSVAVPYDESFVRDKAVCQGLYYGASLTALTRVAARKGYRLVACENVNAFFVRDDVAGPLPACEPGLAFQLYGRDHIRLERLDADVLEKFRETGLPLVEIEA